MKNEKGFTLIELMIVISVIGILAAIAVPQFNTYKSKACRSEGFSLSSPLREDIIDFLSHTGRFPENNFQCGIPEPEMLKGKYVESIRITNGIITISFNNFMKSLEGKYIRLTPVLNPENPTGPVVWERKSGDIKESPSEKTSGKKKKS